MSASSSASSYSSASSSRDPRQLRLDALVGYDKNLVLDVINNEVVLLPKENGKRSQLWRMDAKGQLIHEGSSPPRNPRRPGSVGGDPEAKQSCFVLDIADTAVQVGNLIARARERVCEEWLEGGGRDSGKI